jgi:hypothetical protein
VKLTGEFTSLQEPTDDSDIVIFLFWLVDESSFAGFERRVKPKDLTRMFRLLIIKSIFWFLLTSGLLLVKSKKAVEFMIPTTWLPTVSAN